MYSSLILAIFCAASGVLSSSTPTPCKRNDQSCLDKMANDLRPQLFAAWPEHGIESSDPVHVKKIIGDLSVFKFKLFNSSLVGYSNCVVSNLKISEDMTKFQCDLNCPKFTMSGKYEMKGQLVGIPAEGNGDYTFLTGQYFVHVEAEMKKIDVNDGKTHAAIKNFKLKIEPREPIKFDLSNLFNGQKDLEAAFNKFANENWREVAEFIQDPIWYTCTKQVISNINKRLKIIPVENLIAN